MVAVFACLDASWLERIKTGQLSDAEIDQVASHLEGCPKCAANTQAVEEYKVLTAAARSGAKRLDLAPQPVVVDLMRQLQELCASETAVNDGNTPFPSPDAPEKWLATLLAAAQGPDELGRLGIYRVLRVLGKGGMGLVLEAEDTLLKRRVALKVILPHLLGHKDSRQRFLREARAAAALQSDYIVPIHQVGEERGVPFLAMPLLHGESLETRLRRDGKLPLRDVLRLGSQIAQGLAVAHEHGLIHRDIKPSNIWLQSAATRRSSAREDTPDTKGFRVKILDFGLARETDSAEARLTGSGSILGTPGYMSPEQVDSQPLDGRSDLFSLGCVLYQISTGKPAFRGDSLMQILRSLITDTPQSPRSLNRELPMEFSDLIQQLVSKDPSKRPASAACVGQQLASLERGFSAPLLPKASKAKSASSAARGSQELATLDRRLPSPAGPKAASARRGRRLALAACLLLLIAGGAFVGWQMIVGQGAGKDAKQHGGIPHQASTDPDRRAAEWVLSIDGSITIKENGKEREIKAPGDLPVGAFELTEANLSRNPKVNDAGLANFKDCKNLTVLGLSDTTVSDTGLANFKDCKNLAVLSLGFAREVTDVGLANFKDCKDLTALNLQATKVSDVGLAYFKNRTNLTTLYLSHTSVSDAGLVHFKDCKKLGHLEMGNVPDVTNAGLANFKGCKNLHFLQLNGTQVSDAGLANFKDSNNLFHLDLHGTTVSDVGLANFKDCKKIGQLHLHGTQVSDAGLAHFKDCKGIRQLLLGATKVSDAGLHLFKDCGELYLLTLYDTSISDAGLALFKNCKSLRALILDTTQVSDAVLTDLAGLPALIELNIARTRISLHGYEQLKAAMPKCEIQWSEPNRSVAESVLALGGTVEIGAPDKQESRPAKYAADLPREYFQVRLVSLARIDKALDKLPEKLSLLRFPAFDRLESIDFTKTEMNDAALAHLSKLPALKLLVLDDCEIRGTGLAHLGDPPALIDLKLGCPSLTDLFAKNLAELKQVKRLSLAGSSLSDPGIKHLSTLSNLESLDLRGTKATATGIAELQKALPKCQIEWDGKKN